LNKNYINDGYPIFINGLVKRKVVQAYADGLLIFTNTRENLNRLTDAISNFMSFAKIHFNPDKCKLIQYNPDKEMEVDLFLKDDKGNDKKVEVCKVNETVKYLGVPLGIMKLIRMKFNEHKVGSIMKILHRLKESGLKITQIIHAIKTFVLPRMDYIMMNSIVKLTSLEKIDRFIRKIINEKVGGPCLSTDLFYSSWKNGGFGLKLLTERYAACNLNNIAHFFLRGDDTRNLIKWQLHEEARVRKIEMVDDEKNENNYFFNWNLERKILKGRISFNNW
jgi:hypothetical protein